LMLINILAIYGLLHVFILLDIVIAGN
jgi:hypothetical protein